MAELLLDTDIFIDHLRGARRLNPGGDSLSFSVVTRAELFAGQSADEDELRGLLAPFRELPLNVATAELAGRLRRETGLALADAMVAATALIHRLQLLTRNRKHFEQVPGLQLAPSSTGG